jgi:hypothetical protein
MVRRVIVFGDSFDHKVVIPRTKNVDPSDPNVRHEMERFGPRYISYSKKTGAPFLAATINCALGIKDCARFHEIAIKGDSDAASGADGKIIEIIDLYEYFSKTDSSDERVLRRERRYITHISGNFARGSRGPRPPKQVSDAVALFYDYDSGFRRNAKPDDATKTREFETKRNAAVMATIKDPSAVIVVIGDNIDVSCIDAYSNLIGGLSGEKKKTIIIVRLKLLKSAGLTISDDTTLEKLIEDMGRYFRHSEKPPADVCEELSRKLRTLADNIIIIADNIVLNIDKNSPKSSLQFLPNFFRPTKGKMPHELGVYASAIASLMADETLEEANFHEALNETIRLALLTFSYSFDLGIDCGRDGAIISPFDALERILHPARLAKEVHKPTQRAGISNDLNKVLENKDNKFDRYLISSIVFPLDRSWKRTDVYSNSNARDPGPAARAPDIHEICRKIVRFGIKDAGRSRVPNSYREHWPQSTIACPYAEYGKLKLLDSVEIEEYASCSRIISNYLRDVTSEKPLSIGLFGTPGTGKSFAVTQLVNSSRVGPAPEPKVFNLAQFNSIDQLTECFHSIQSAVLASKAHPPLVMFDEFDSEFEGNPLGWLKYFLAPMQDGAFQGKTGMYQIGRAIFAFAGGRSEKFDIFQKQIDELKDTAKTVKLPISSAGFADM